VAWQHTQPGRDYPPLLLGKDGDARLAPLWTSPALDEMLSVRLFPGPDPARAWPSDEESWPDDFLDRTPLTTRPVDLLAVVPPDFRVQLEQGKRPQLALVGRDNDERSRLLEQRMQSVLGRWKTQLKEVRLLRQGLPGNYDDPFEVREAERGKPGAKRAAERLFEFLIRIFPFVLVMWSLAGALYPAIDLCAGEKERGTMETLLISPASRDEIVWGKFLAISV